jgi:hypothetical protein
MESITPTETESTCAILTIPDTGSEVRLAFNLNRQHEEPMSNQHSVTKRHRRPKSEKRADYSARTMAAVKLLEQAAKLKAK